MSQQRAKRIWANWPLLIFFFFFKSKYIFFSQFTFLFRFSFWFFFLVIFFFFLENTKFDSWHAFYHTNQTFTYLSKQKEDSWTMMYVRLFWDWGDCCRAWVKGSDCDGEEQQSRARSARVVVVSLALDWWVLRLLQWLLPSLRLLQWLLLELDPLDFFQGSELYVTGKGEGFL
jgi:hypothetical protein